MVDNNIALTLDLKNIQKIQFSLNSIGSWPNQACGDHSFKARMLHFYNIFLLVEIILAEYTLYKYVVRYMKVLNFIDLGELYITWLLGIVFLVRLTLPLTKGYGITVKEFLGKFHLLHHKHNSDFSLKIYNRVEELSALAIKVCLSQMYLGVIVFNIFPMYKNYNNGMYRAEKPVNGTFDHALKHDLPFDHYHDPFFYVIMFFFNWYLSYNVICSICCVDLLLCIIVIHIWGHLSILEYNLNSFPPPAQELSDNSTAFAYSKEEDRNVFYQLKALITQHNMIKDFLSITSKAFSTSICVYYAFHQLAGCLLLLECSTMDPNALSKFGLLTLVMFQQLVSISVIFELIGTKLATWFIAVIPYILSDRKEKTLVAFASWLGPQGDTLVDAVYGMPWECMGAGNRRAVLLFLQNVQTPLALKAANVVPVGVQTMSAIMRGSWSYFLMLKTLSD